MFFCLFSLVSYLDWLISGRMGGRKYPERHYLELAKYGLLVVLLMETNVISVYIHGFRAPDFPSARPAIGRSAETKRTVASFEIGI